MKEERRQKVEVAMRELRRTCIHEAGHSVVLRRLGGIGTANVWRNSRAAVLQGEKAWRGHVTMYQEPGRCTFARGLKARYGIVRTPKDWRVLVGLAGLASEAIDEGDTDPHAVLNRIAEAFYLDEVSATDAQMIGDSYSLFQVRRAVRLLTTRWEDVLSIAMHLEATAG